MNFIILKNDRVNVVVQNSTWPLSSVSGAEILKLIELTTEKLIIISVLMRLVLLVGCIPKQV